MPSASRWTGSFDDPALALPKTLAVVAAILFWSCDLQCRPFSCWHRFLFPHPFVLFCVCLFVFSSAVACCNFHIIIHHIQLICWLIWIRIQDIFNWLCVCVCVCVWRKFVRHSDAICKISCHTFFFFFLSCPSQENYRQTSNHPSDWLFWKLGFPCNNFHFRGFLTHFSASGDDPFLSNAGESTWFFWRAVPLAESRQPSRGDVELLVCFTVRLWLLFWLVTDIHPVAVDCPVCHFLAR